MAVTPIVKPDTQALSGEVHSIGIAGVKVVRAPDRISTVLGSCIGVALYDRVAKLGGMAHVILPSSTEGSGDPCKFADTAVDILLEMIVKEGAEPKRIAAKIAGGARMFGTASKTGKLGERNAEAVQAQLRHHGIRLVASAVGGTKGRKMWLNPANGEVEVKIIGQESEII